MKKFIALLLSVLTLLSVAPIAFAAEETTVAETTTVANEETTKAETSDTSVGDLFGGFFKRIGDLLKIVIDFLANLFNGTSGDLGSLK